MVNEKFDVRSLSQTNPKAYIHLNRLRENYANIKKNAGNCTIMSIVKTNGYGHGGVLVSQILAEEGCNWFGVFTHEEGIELREAGIKQNIFILCKMNLEGIEAAIEHNLILNLSSWIDFQMLEWFYRKNQVLPKVHLKIDTGMTRLGFDLCDTEYVLEKIVTFKELDCQGVYSHFATADEGDLSYAHTQLERFKSILNTATQKGIQFKYKHFSNSGALLSLPDSQFNMLRVGLLLYGVYPSNEVPRTLKVKPVMNFKGTVVEIRKIKAGVPVSYGGVWTAKKETNIGIIQAGFADGVPRPWYENGYVEYNGKQYPIAGRICMDQMTVDFGDDTVAIGNEVNFWGGKTKSNVSIEEIAKSISSTPYVILTGLGSRVSRIPLS